MVSIDDNAQVGIELATSTLRLTGKALIAIMDLFLKEDNRKDYYQDLKPDTKKGKQNVKDLFDKYENTEVQSLDNNISKEEVTNIQKELKSMGVDFSIKKIEKNNYSLFFAGKDIEAIEKGMKNAMEKYSMKSNRIRNIKNILFDFKSEPLNQEEEEVFNSISNDLTTIDDIKESEVYEKLNLLKEEPTSKQLNLAKELGVEDYEKMNKIEISLALEKAGAEKSFFNEKQLEKSISNNSKKEISKDSKKENNKKENNQNNKKPNFNIGNMKKENSEKQKEKKLLNKKVKSNEKTASRSR